MLIEKRQIILIDDEQNKCEIFLNAVEKISSLFKCSYVSNTRELKRYAKKTVPDFIFFDMTKPDRDDLLCLEAVKNDKSIRHIPFYIYADHLDRQTVKKAAELGVSSCIKKPKDVRTLIKLLEGLFYQSRRADIRNYAPRKKD